MHSPLSFNPLQEPNMPSYFEPWLDYQQPVVRQLAFCLASPNLICSTPTELQQQQSHPFAWHDDDFWKQHYLNYIPKLRRLDQDPQTLIDFLASLKSTRLGLRFEYLIWFWLLDADYHCYDLLAHSHQVIEGAYTRGELDFVLFNRQSQSIEHWEVALKYYLGESDLSLAHWYGLNRDDTLNKKLRHFCLQQFKFDQIGDTTITQRFAVMKGQFYLPIQRNGCPTNITPCNHEPSQRLPAWLNLQRRLGIWGHQIQPSYRRLNRLEWLCPDQQSNTKPVQWWCNGLYHHTDNSNNLSHFNDYMFRVSTSGIDSKLNYRTEI